MQETFCHSASLSTLGFSFFFICESAFHSNRCIVASCVCVCTQSLSCVYFATTRTVAHQAPMSMGLFRQEYWSGLPFLPPGDLPDPGIEPTSPASPAFQADSLSTEPSGKTRNHIIQCVLEGMRKCFKKPDCMYQNSTMKRLKE